jgi:uncharacterized protein YjbI with pentapeptide repeats
MDFFVLHLSSFDLSDSTIASACFKNCSLKKNSVRHFLVKYDFQKPDMRNSSSSEANLKDADLCLANLKNTSFGRIKMGGSKLVKTKCKNPA